MKVRQLVRVVGEDSVAGEIVVFECLRRR